MAFLDRIKSYCSELVTEDIRRDAARNFMCSYTINAFMVTNINPMVPLVGGTLAATTEVVRRVTYEPFHRFIMPKMPNEFAFGVLLHAAFIYAVMGSLGSYLVGFKLSILATIAWSTKVSMFAGMPVNLFIADAINLS